MSALVRVVEGQKRMEGGFRDAHKASNELTEAIGELKDKAADTATEITRMATAFLTLEGVKQIVDGIGDKLEHLEEELREFQEAASASSDPRYLGHEKDYAARSLTLSESYGGNDLKAVIEPLRKRIDDAMSPETTTSVIESLEESALKYHSLSKGSSPLDVATAETNLIKVYGGTAQQAEGNTRFLEENGVPVAEQAMLGQQLDLGFKARGVTLDERDAFMAMIAGSGGKESSVGKGLLALMYDRDKLIKKGAISGKGNLMGDFDELEKFQAIHGDQLDDILGMRAAPALTYFNTHREDFSKLMQARRGSGDDLVDRELGIHEKDPDVKAGELAEQRTQVRANALLHASEKEKEAADAWDLSTTEFERDIMTQHGFAFTRPVAGMLYYPTRAADYFFSPHVYAQAGKFWQNKGSQEGSQLLEDSNPAINAGWEAAAGRMAAGAGTIISTDQDDLGLAKPNRVRATNQADAAQFLAFRQQGYDINPQEFDRYLGMRESRDWKDGRFVYHAAQAQQYLEQFKRADSGDGGGEVKHIVALDANSVKAAFAGVADMLAKAIQNATRPQRRNNNIPAN